MIIYQLLKQKEYLVCNYAFETFTRKNDFAEGLKILLNREK